MARDGFLFPNGNGVGEEQEEDKEKSSSKSRSAQVSAPPSAVGVGANGGGVNYIYHTVTKFDTLAGVAIKYGVEVADIKRLNGLVTDLQMFALKALQIPLPGRHPPSPILSNGEENPKWQWLSSSTEINRRHSDIMDSLQSLKLRSPSSQRKITPAMNSLRGYYCIKPKKPKASSEGCEMSVYYRKENPRHSEELPLPNSDLIPLSHHRKSKSAANGFHTPEKLLKKESSGNPSQVSAITGKALALRPKSANRAVGEVNVPNPSTAIPLSFGDSYPTQPSNGVRKSSSTPLFQDSNGGNNGLLSSMWATSKWSLKPDFQGLSAAAIARPILDGLPKPMSWIIKTALD